jgi:hypothetical protein
VLAVSVFGVADNLEALPDIVRRLCLPPGRGSSGDSVNLEALPDYPAGGALSGSGSRSALLHGLNNAGEDVAQV